MHTTNARFTRAEIREHRRLWVEALRSGEYKQGTGVLCATMPDGTKKYCCLGVACELSGADKYVDQVRATTPDGEVMATMYDGQYTILPEYVQAWLGVHTGNPAVEWGHDQKVATLAHLNDGENLGFDQIADIVEDVPKEGIGPWMPVAD